MNRKAQSASSWVYEDLRDRIESLSYAPGSELDLSGLCEEYGVSRSPVRDARVCSTMAATELPEGIAPS